MEIFSLFKRLWRRTRPLLQAPTTGGQAEDLAAEYLRHQGLRILERNYRCRQGELDLICRDGNTVVFVEVRLRQSAQHGGAAASVTHKKRQRIVKAARHWLSQQAASPCRFDCVVLDQLTPEAITWIRHAFDEQ